MPYLKSVSVGRIFGYHSQRIKNLFCRRTHCGNYNVLQTPSRLGQAPKLFLLMPTVPRFVPVEFEVVSATVSVAGLYVCSSAFLAQRFYFCFIFFRFQFSKSFSSSVVFTSSLLSTLLSTPLLVCYLTGRSCQFLNAISVSYRIVCVICAGCVQLEGTWQVLVRSTFRQTSTLPSTIRFIPEHGGTIRLVRVRSIK